MSQRFLRHIFFAQAALLLSLSLCMSACNGRTEEPQANSEPDAVGSEIIIYQTDSTEWHILLFKEHLLYSEALAVELPEPWLLPTREDAQILKTCSYPHDERFVTSDGYTFGMPSASVTKAGAKTKYSILGMRKRPLVINVRF